jgi:hypothetical protein
LSPSYFAGEQVDQDYLTSIPLDYVGSDHLVRVGTLDQHIRPDRSTEAKDERTVALTASCCIGRCGPLRRLTEASVLSPTTSRSQAARACASK